MPFCKPVSVRPAVHRGTDAIEGAALLASLGCLAHCLALPLLLLLLPGTLGLFAESEAFHAVAFALVVPTALMAFWLGHRCHGGRSPGLVGIAGLAALLAALSVDAAPLQLGLTVTGSLLLVCGHLLNWRLRNRVARAPNP